MNSFQRNSLFLAVVIFGLFLASGLTYYIYQSHQAKVAEEKVAWKKENIRRLKDLSNIGTLSTEEQNRLDAAGNDVDRIQQVLLDLHTDRHTYWTVQLTDLEEKEAKLRNVSDLELMIYGGQLRETASALHKQRQEIEDNLQGFENSLRLIHAWKPITFEEYLKEQENQKTNGNTPSTNSDSSQSYEQPSEVESSPTSKPSPLHTISNAPTIAPNPNPETGGDSAQINQLLTSWQRAMLANNSASEAALYSPIVSNYYGHMGVSNSYVQADKQAFIDRGNNITSLSLDDVTIENKTATSATVQLVKNVSWQGNNGSTHKLISSRLLLERDADGWKISGEQDSR